MIFILLLAVVIYYLVVVLQARTGTIEKFETFLNSEQVKVQKSDLSNFQLEALLKVQDPSFYTHNGFDIKTPGAGVTTITQSLVKRFYFEEFKQGIPKIKQSLIAVYAVDPLISKDEQLTVFINEFPFNDEAIGFAGAANYYFAKDFQDLNNDEYLSIIAMFISPRAYDIEHNPATNQERVERIQALLEGDYIPKSNSDVYYNLE